MIKRDKVKTKKRLLLLNVKNVTHYPRKNTLMIRFVFQPFLNKGLNGV